MAWTAPRTWTDGELVTAAIMNPHVRDNLKAVSFRLLARKTADTSRNTTTTLADDTHLTWAIAANEEWNVKLGLWMVAANATPDIKVAITTPAGAAFTLSTIAFQAGSLSRILWNTSGTSAQIDLTTTAEFYELTGIVANGGTAGNITMQWAQQTSDGGNTTVKKGSYFAGSLT